MIRHALIQARTGSSQDFRIRGTEVSRVEGLTDAVFALAMTLLIVSVEVPASFDELMSVVRGLPAFAACFAILMWFWFLHYRFCRRYGHFDGWTLVLNSALLFVVLFYVYPLKFVFRIFVAVFTGLGIGGGKPIAIEPHQVGQLFVLYGAGFGAIFGIFTLMYAHALSRRRELGLTPAEIHETRIDVYGCLSLVAVAMLSIVLSLTLSPRNVQWAGWVYTLVGISETIAGSLRHRGPTRAAQQPHEG